MPSTARLSRPAAAFSVFFALCLGGPVHAQIGDDGLVSGQAGVAWEKWNAALAALLARNADGAETLFGELLEGEPSPFRLALLAERSVQRNENAGGVLLLEQDAESEALGPNGQQVYQALETGREQMNEADDGWYFASIGRFGIANANFQALLNSEPDPVALLEFSDRVPRRQTILVQLAGHPVIGESVGGVLKLLQQGEQLIKADPIRVREHISRLDGPPRAYENAVAYLKDSGEYAIPFMVEDLRDSEKQALTPAIVRTLPRIGRPGLNPMVVALRMDDPTTAKYLVSALGEIGYWQAVPYLVKLRDDSATIPDVKTSVAAALGALAGRGVAVDPGLTAAQAFYQLADAYYADTASLAADPRLDSANVWYWRDRMLQNIKVPTPIFNEVMCMRCCEEALLLDPNLRPALALWLAANFRREAQLPEGEIDHTRPANNPPSDYFAQSAGADYCLTALARGVDDGDPAVALGAINALRKTAGASSIVGDQAGRNPLAEALSFPDRMVRIRAGLALGNALPTQAFQNYQNLIPVLSEALTLFGGAQHALVVDADAESANAAADAIRGLGYTAVTSSALLPGLQTVRNELPGLDVILLASDLQSPDLPTALTQIRSDFHFAAVPIVVVAKKEQLSAVQDMVRADHRLGVVEAGPTAENLTAAIAKVSKAVGAQAITPTVGTGLSLEAAQTLGLLAITNNPLFNVKDAEPALINALQSDDADLRVTAAQVLGYLGTSTAQEAVARIALDEEESEEMRVAMFAALADAAKHHGSQLSENLVQMVIAAAESHENMAIRTAASQALGAQNLPGNPASAIIRNQYGG